VTNSSVRVVTRVRRADSGVQSPGAAVVRPPRPKHRHNRAGYLFLLPWMVGIFGLTLAPMLYSLFLSFTKFDLLSSPRWAGLENYREMFTDDPRFMQSVRVTLTYVAVSVPLKLICALVVALALNRGLSP